MARPAQITLGPTQGVHQPSYELRGYRDGDPRLPITGVDLRSVTAIQTNKDLRNITGTFTITLKDRGVRRRVREMDVFRIRLRGHRPGLYPVMVGVVDRARAAGSSDAYASKYDSIIEGRCVGKYYVVNSLFLPVWDPEANLPTALTFGIGDAAKKVGGNRPYDIHRYLVQRFIFNKGQIAGLSGTPNARHWLDINTRFAKHLNYSVPFLQFDEDPMDVALKRLEILGFTEAWIDEIGRVVYRHPQWDAPVHYNLPTSELIDHDLPRSDEEVSTYVEVIPAGDPGIDSSIAQALRAGRAPVPSSYVNAAPELAGNVRREFVIDTDAHGKVTAEGRRNHWYRLQKRLGLRPQQLSSPLLFDQAQAQRQAEGLLQFYGRTTKTISGTIPGCPELRLGYTARVHGDLDEEALDRTFYIEQVGHDYVEGESYTTSFYATHGRDPWDPHFREITLPKYSPEALAHTPGVLGPATDEGTMGDPTGNAGERAAFAASAIGRKHYPYVWGGGHAHIGIPDGGTGRDAGTGFDCSGGAAAVLDAAGLAPKSWARGVPTSGAMATSWGEPGVGKTLTMYASATHVFLVATVNGKQVHLGTGRWGTTEGGYGVKKVLHPTAGFTARRWPGT